MVFTVCDHVGAISKVKNKNAIFLKLSGIDL